MQESSVEVSLTSEGVRLLMLEALIRAEIERQQHRAPWFAHVAECAARGQE